MTHIWVVRRQTVNCKVSKRLSRIISYYSTVSETQIITDIRPN